MATQSPSWFCLALLATLAACDPPDEERAFGSCASDSECSADEMCDRGMCVLVDEDGSGGDEDEGPADNPKADGGAVGEEGGADGDAPAEEGGAPADDGGTPADDGGSDTGGTCFADAGEACSVNGDCCGFLVSSAGCIDYAEGRVCAALCNSHDECWSGCCAALEGTSYGACSAPEYCSAPSDCGQAWCEYNWCVDGIATSCPDSFYGDGSCDCGCGWEDIDC